MEPTLHPRNGRLSDRAFDALVNEAHSEWGTRFFVISGGEPLAYRSEGQGILDLAERFPDCFFVTYTNGSGTQRSTLKLRSL